MKKLKNFIRGCILGIAGLGLVGCATTQVLPPGGQTTESVITACSSYSTVLNTLTPIKSKLPANDVSTVNKSNVLTHPICSNPSAYNSSGALAAILSETANLKSILSANGGKP